MRSLTLATVFIGWAVLTAGCASPREPLMDTPVIWHGAELDLFGHLAEPERINPLTVHYATRRRPEHIGDTDYGSEVDARVHLGTTRLSFGADIPWPELVDLSFSAERSEPVELFVEHALEYGAHAITDPVAAPHTHAGFIEQLEERLKAARDPEIVIYVHGAKVDF